MKLMRILFPVLMISFITGVARAQQDTEQLQLTQYWDQVGAARLLNGQVRDALDSPVPGAMIEVKNAATNETYLLKADERGVFKKDDLADGKYLVTITASGFYICGYTVSIRRQNPSASNKYTVLRLSSSCGGSINSGLALVSELSQPSFKPSIFSFDFTNFTYQNVGELRSYLRREFITLKCGGYRTSGAERVIFEKQDFGDVTGDGREEAIVSLTVLPHVRIEGTTVPVCVYIYTWKRGRPVLLWGFLASNGSGGGLVRIIPEGHGFLLQLSGEGAHIGKLVGTRSDDASCATSTHYQWRPGGFRQIGKSEISCIGPRKRS